MNFSTNAKCGRSKENLPTSSKTDAAQVQWTKKRTVLGVLSENEQRGRTLSQGGQFSKNSSISESSHLSFPSCPSGSSYDVYVEEACEVVLTASGQRVVSDRDRQDNDSAALQIEDMRLLLELSSGSCQDISMESEVDESLMSEERLSVSDYVEDIHQHLRATEMRYRPRAAYLERHTEITDSMRVILVDWLVEVVEEYKLRSETLHLAVNYLDRFLSHTANVKRGKLQLVGTAALLIAAKYEEILPPELNEFVYTTDSTYTKKQLIRMEHLFLKVLAFKMAAPTIYQFLHLFMSIHSVCVITKNLALYLADLILLERYLFIQYSPSLLAAGAYCLASYTVNRSQWPDSLRAFAGYTMADIVPCITDLHKLFICAETHPQQAIREKYKNSKYCYVSLITPPTAPTFL